MVSYKTGALFFIISRTLGATARLYLVINILQIFILDNLGMPFWLTTVIILLMIILYTFEGGVKTIVFTDTLQTSFMLLGLVVCTIFIMNNLGHSFSATMNKLDNLNLTRVFNTDINSSSHFLKHILGGFFTTVAMARPEMMQKDYQCKEPERFAEEHGYIQHYHGIGELPVPLLGGLLYLSPPKRDQCSPDDLFPTAALSYMPTPFPLSLLWGSFQPYFRAPTAHLL